MFYTSSQQGQEGPSRYLVRKRYVIVRWKRCRSFEVLPFARLFVCFPSNPSLIKVDSMPFEGGFSPFIMRDGGESSQDFSTFKVSTINIINVIDNSSNDMLSYIRGKDHEVMNGGSPDPKGHLTSSCASCVAIVPSSYGPGGRARLRAEANEARLLAGSHTATVDTSWDAS
jgi:hypothetical protein